MELAALVGLSATAASYSAEHANGANGREPPLAPLAG
jgi:hypothetical protein